MNSAGSINDQHFDQICHFVIQLGTVAHGYGVSSYRLASFLRRTSEALSVSGGFQVTPASINFTFWQDDETTQRSYFLPMAPTTFDMSKLAAIGELVDQVEAGTLSMEDGVRQLQDIPTKKAQFGAPWVGLGYALAGAGFAVLLSAAWHDVLLSGVLSLVVFAIVLLAGRYKRVASSLELTATFTASLLANAAALVSPGSDVFIVTLCAVIVLIPGLGLTLGIAEILSRQTVSGISRLVDALMVTLKLFIGATLGTVLISTLVAVPAPVQPPPISAYWTWTFVVLLVVGLAIVFQVRPKDIGWTVLAGILAYGGVVLGSSAGFWQGSFVGALLLGAYANLYAWWLRRPTSIVMLTAIMVLVPGASAYRGLEAVHTAGVASGISAEWQVLVNIGAILAGLVVAYSVIPPKATL